MNFKKNSKEIIIIFILLILKILEILKYRIMNINFNITSFLIESLVILAMYVINLYKLRKYKFINNFINLVLIIVSLLSLLFNSFNTLGILSLYLFFLLITFTCMTISNQRFEISLIISTSLLILLFVLLGVVGLLKYSYGFLIFIAICCILYLIKNKKAMRAKIQNTSKENFTIFSVLFLIAILGGVGRYVHKWDEYSYWAYAAKVIIETDSVKQLVSYVGTMNVYPPVSSIWHYIISLFLGYSEPNLYIGLMILDFIYIMPVFMKITTKNKFLMWLLVAVTAGFPYLFNGSITYGLLYVDLLLGFMCSSVLILHDYLKEKKESLKSIYLILIVITLLKPNGFVFSCCLIFLFFLKDVFNLEEFKIRKFFEKLKKYIIPLGLILLLFILWRICSNLLFNENFSYMFKLIPESLSTNISQKLNFSFILNYFYALKNSIDESILYSFINFPLFFFLIFTFTIIYFIDKKENNSSLVKSILPYIIFYVVFYILTALSLFIMFTYYEASQLASFSRYLAPINISLVSYLLYKTSYIYKNKIVVTVFYLFIVTLVGFSNMTFFVTDVKERRETMHTSISRQETFAAILKNTSEHSKIFVINQEDVDSIMPMWYARYYCYPRVVNANPNAITWKIKTPSNEWDLNEWGLTGDIFDKHIVAYKFDYVFIYSATDELYEELSDDFNDINEAKKYKLFKVDIIDNSKIKLMPVE